MFRKIFYIVLILTAISFSREMVLFDASFRKEAGDLLTNEERIMYLIDRISASSTKSELIQLVFSMNCSEQITSFPSNSKGCYPFFVVIEHESFPKLKTRMLENVCRIGHMNNLSLSNFIVNYIPTHFAGCD